LHFLDHDACKKNKKTDPAIFAPPYAQKWDALAAAPGGLWTPGPCLYSAPLLGLEKQGRSAPRTASNVGSISSTSSTALISSSTPPKERMQRAAPARPSAPHGFVPPYPSAPRRLDRYRQKKRIRESSYRPGMRSPHRQAWNAHAASWRPKQVRHRSLLPFPRMAGSLNCRGRSPPSPCNHPAPSQALRAGRKQRPLRSVLSVCTLRHRRGQLSADRSGRALLTGGCGAERRPQ